MKGWKILPVVLALMVSIIIAGNAAAQGEPDDDDEDPFGGLFDMENAEMEVSLEWSSLEKAELEMSVEMELGAYGSIFKAFLDADKDGEIEEDEISEFESPFDGEDMEEGPLGLMILIDNQTADIEFEGGWTGILGDVDSDEPIGMYALTTFTWDIDESLERHTIALRPVEEYESEEPDPVEEPDDDNWTYVDDDEYENWTGDDDDEGMPFNMTFVINLPDGWKIDTETVVPESMKQFMKDDNTIEFTPADIEAIGEPEGDIVSFDIVKGSDDSPFPVWIPLGALLIGALSVGLLRRRRR